MTHAGARYSVHERDGERVGIHLCRRLDLNPASGADAVLDQNADHPGQPLELLGRHSAPRRRQVFGHRGPDAVRALRLPSAVAPGSGRLNPLHDD
ncbi:hypothetical protein [Streptomyces sp. DT171]|uniref:hypothetical protein n=1 Tax=Streptomyces sp. DT171 TaxID=3416524 RepID=UPI003CFB452A